MRKFSKILTVLLTLCLLCGVILSVVASAENTNQLNVTEATDNRNVDFQDGSVGAWNNYRGQYIKFEVATAADGENKYYSMTSNTEETEDATANVQLGWKACDSGYSSTLGDAYVVIDFDFGTDRYVYTDANGIKHTVDAEGKPITSVDQIPEGCEYDLAYSTSGSYFTFRALKIADGKYAEIYQQSNYKVGKDSNGWYMTNPNTNVVTAKKVYLSGELGVFDHVTFVLRNTFNEDGTLKTAYIYGFVNGEFMCSSSLSGATYSDVRLEKLTITQPTYVVGESDNFAMAYDNLAINHYAKGSELCAGLDAYFTRAGYQSVNLTSCDNIVYTDKYVTPNPKRTFSVNGTEYVSVGAAFDKLEEDNGGTVVIGSTLKGVKVDAVKSFTVVAENGAEFTLHPDVASSYDVTETVEGDTTTYVFLAKGTFADDSWLDVTGDWHNHANAYGTTKGGANNGNRFDTNVWNGVTTGYAQINDGDYFKGASAGITNGIFQIVNDSSVTPTHPTGATAQYWYMSPYRPSPLGWSDGDITNYDYVIADFDFGTHRYAYTTSDGVKETGTTVPEGATNVRPAYASGMAVGVSYVGFSAEPTSFASGTEGRYASKLEVSIIEIDGLYYAQGANGNVLLSNKVGEFDHVSFVFDPANRKIVAFVNGQYVKETTYSSSWIVTNFAATYMSVPGTAIKVDNQAAMAADNNAVNWYKDAADTNTGIAAFMKGDYENGKLYNCDDVLYNKGYVPHSSYVTVGDDREFLPGIIHDKIYNLENEGKVTTSKDLYNILPTADVIYVQTSGDAKFTLSAEADTYIIEDQGEGLYKVRKLAEEDLVKIDIVDHNDKILDSFYLAPKAELKVPTFDVSYFDIETRKAYTFENWYMTRDSNETVAEGYSYSDITTAPKEIKVYAKYTESQVAETFAIYTTSGIGYNKLVGTASDYDSMANFAAKFNAVPDGATIVLLYDLNTPYDINSATKTQITLQIPANRTVSLDLNGRTLVHSYGGSSAYGGYMIKVGSGATFNLYSSVEGGALYQARPHLNPNNSSWGQICAPGILYTEGAVGVTINVDGAVSEEYKNNLSMYGGSLYYASTATNTTDEVATINVGGGFYYSFARSGSAVFTLTASAGIVNINLKDAKFYNNPDSYGIFYDYNGTSYHRLVADNCEFIAKGANDSAYKNIYYGQNASSTAVFTNCVLIGKMSGVKGKITLGEGNICAGFSTNDSTIVLDAGNKVIKTADKSVKYSVAINAHPDIYITDYLEYKKVDGWYYKASDDHNNFADYNPDYVNNASKDMMILDTTTIPAGEDITTWTNTNKFWTAGLKFYLNPVVYDKNTWVTDRIVTASDVFMTYVDGTALPAAINTVTGKDANGNALFTEKWVDGSAIIVTPTSKDMGMYKATNMTWTEKSKTEFVLTDYTVAGDFSDMKVNATLTNGMIYNIYVPADAGVELTGVSEGTLKEELFTYGGVSYYVISVELAAQEFDAIEINATFSAASLVGGDAKVGTQALKADIVKYAADVATQYACGSEEASLVYEMMNYKEAVATVLDAEYARNEATTAFYALHADGCGCAVEMVVSDSEVADLDALTGITGAGFDIDSVGAIKVLFYSKNANLEVSVSYTAGVGENAVTKTVPAIYNSESEAYVTEGIPAAYIDNILTVTVDGAEGTYCLAAYIASEGTPEAAKNVATALYKYAMAAEDFKHVTKTEAAAQ